MDKTKKKNFFTYLYSAICDTGLVFIDEMKISFTDTGVIIFFFIVPFLYPALYSWLYNNEIMKDVPTAVIDNNHSSLSREFTRKLDATEGIWVKSYCNNIEEAKELMMSQECKAIVSIPESFSSDIIRKKQTSVSLYADMSGMLYYKSALMALTNVSLDMWEKIQISQMTTYTDEDNNLAVRPLEYKDVPIFNPAGGYGSFLLPGVLMLIIQQTLLLGIGLAAGTVRENNRYNTLVPIIQHHLGTFKIVFGKALCYFLIYMVTGAYITIAIPNMFHFIQLASFHDILALLIPYLLACIFFGITISSLIRYRENVIMIIVFTSVALLFLSGVSWPGSSIHGTWKAVSYLFPSTFGINAFVKLNSMGASFNEISTEFHCLWLQVGIYFITSAFVYWRQMKRSIRMRAENTLTSFQRGQRRRGLLKLK